MRFSTFFVTQDREHPVYLSIHNKFSLKTDTLVLASSNSPVWFRPLACENCLLPILFVNEEKNSLLTRSVYVIWSTFFTFHNSLQCFFRVDSSSHSRIFANKLRLQSSPVLWRIFDPLVTEPTFIGTSFYTDLLGRKKKCNKNDSLHYSRNLFAIAGFGPAYWYYDIALLPALSDSQTGRQRKIRI